MFDDLQTWITQNWKTVVFILIFAFITHRFGNIVVSNLIKRTVRQRAHGDTSDEDIRKRQDTLISMCNAVLRAIVWLIATFSIIRLLFPKLDLTPILASASVMGVAIGFGAQTIIKDFLTGMFIVLENQYRVGDVVQIDSATGTVEQITIRSTVIRDNDGSVHYIPNGSITHAINKTMGFAKINITISVAPSTDVDKLAEIINQAGEKLASDEKWKKKIMEAPHFLSIGAFSDTSLEVKVIGKTQPSARWSVTDEVRRRLLVALRKNNIIPTVSGESNEKDKSSKK